MFRLGSVRVRLFFNLSGLLISQNTFRNGAQMKDSFSWLTPKQAGELSDYSARHIQNMITSGKLNAHKEDGKYYIDKAEFFRVFPKAHKKELEGNSALVIAEKERLEMENQMLKEMTSKTTSEVEFLRSQIEFISNEKTKMMDVIVSNTRLLEHKKELMEEEESAKKRTWKNIFKRK
jgi:hypothetical protein